MNNGISSFSKKSSELDNSTFKRFLNPVSLSSLESKKEIILVNPRGKLYHCLNQNYKQAENEDSEKKILLNNELENLIDGNDEFILNNINRNEIQTLINRIHFF